MINELVRYTSQNVIRKKKINYTKSIDHLFRVLIKRQTWHNGRALNSKFVSFLTMHLRILDNPFYFWFPFQFVLLYNFPLFDLEVCMGMTGVRAVPVPGRQITDDFFRPDWASKWQAIFSRSRAGSAKKKWVFQRAGAGQRIRMTINIPNQSRPTKQRRSFQIVAQKNVSN